jgi:hypothetical protein
MCSAMYWKTKAGGSQTSIAAKHSMVNRSRLSCRFSVRLEHLWCLHVFTVPAPGHNPPRCRKLQRGKLQDIDATSIWVGFQKTPYILESAFLIERWNYESVYLRGSQKPPRRKALKQGSCNSVRIFTTIVIIVQATISLNTTTLDEQEVGSLPLASGT